MLKKAKTISLVFGILSIFMGVVGNFFFGIIVTIPGLILGILGLILSINYKKKTQDKSGGGFVTSIIGIIFCCIFTFLCIAVPSGYLGVVGADCTGLSLFSKTYNSKYAGHGFEYMNGFSSTDFYDYTVYRKKSKSKLVTLDHEPSLIIENREDMPIMDGAEACYPLYASVAKAVYKDIDKIEDEKLTESEESCNGKIVTFTNTIYGFYRLIDYKYYKNYSKVDLFFGAHPSASQMKLANDSGIELEITKIGQEAFVFFVEEDNPVDNLTSDQIRAIYSGQITNWKDVGGKDQGIVAFQRPENSGSQTVMIDFMGDVPLDNPKTYTAKVDAMGQVTEKVAQYYGEEGAIGYTFRYFLEELNQEEGIKMLSVDGIYPSLENIENGSYKTVTDLCLITRKNDPNPYVQKMIDFMLSEDGQFIVRKTGYAGVK